MKKLFITFIIVFTFLKGYSQEKWFSSAELDFIVPNQTEYNYHYDHTGTEINLESKVSFALVYSYNYLIFNKLSAGLLTGVQHYGGAQFFTYKLGANLKYYFVDADNVYTYLQYAHNFTVDKDKFNFGDSFRIGIGFPVMKREGFNLNLNVFYDVTGFDLDGAKPLIFGDEDPSSLYFRSYGISLGVKF